MILVVGCVLFVGSAFSQTVSSDERRSYSSKSGIAEKDRQKVFDAMWRAIDRSYFDATFNGKDWKAIGDQYRPKALAAKDKFELLRVLNSALGELKTSHLRVDLRPSISGKSMKEMFGKEFDGKLFAVRFGFGVTTIRVGEKTAVNAVDGGSPAAEAGIRRGWIEEGCTRRPQTREAGKDLIFSESADCVYFDETGSKREVTMTKAWYLRPRSKTKRVAKTIADDVLYVSFPEFDNDVGKFLQIALEVRAAQKNLIIDLRGNNGGLVTELKESLAPFFGKNTLIGEFVERDLDLKGFRAGSDQNFAGRVVVLVDARSYSAAEIFAAVLQEQKRATVIGQTSGGQVLASFEKDLSNDFRLSVAFRDFRTAGGARLEGNGVKPDIEVPLTIDDLRKGRDPVLARALNFVKN